VAENFRLEELRRRVERDPDSRLVALLTEELRKGGDLAEAIRVARDGLTRDRDNPGLRISLGRALLESGDAVGARREFETLLREAPDNALAHRLLGQCLEALADSGPSRVPSADASRRLALRDDDTGPNAPGARGKGGEEESVYVDFSDEGTVIPAKVSPIVESLGSPDSVAGEALRLLAARVQKLRRDRKVNCLAVTSPLPGEGKSAISLGLAGALAREEDKRILLVEADLRRPSLVPTLGLPPGPGLSEWLGGELAHVPVSIVEPGGFYLLAAGQRGLNRPEVLGSQRMDTLLRAARRLFDFVLLDAVPIMSVADTVLFQDLIDGFLLVVRSRQTPRDAIHDALGRLRAEKVLGVVLNDHEEHRSSYRAYAYGRYGMVDYSRRGQKGGGRPSAGRKRSR
jgi:capsular exopolysaccharide synthesis family protein